MSEHRVPMPGGSLYYRTQGQGPPLLLIGGGPSNADTLSELAARLDDEYTVVSYDRRGYSRSRLDDPAEPASIGQHAADARLILADLALGPAVVFGSSIGAVIALELAAGAPAGVARLAVHEPPLGQLLTGPERKAFDHDEGGDAGVATPGTSAETVLNDVAQGVGVRRGAGVAAVGSVAGGAPAGAALGGGAPAGGVPAARAPAGVAAGKRGGDKARGADIELFVRRDIPAVGRYQLDLGRLAGALGVRLAELPGHHAGMIQYPGEFAAGLRAWLAD
jgi:pimeloyl-ACP methyl ester carboxylesterase